MTALVWFRRDFRLHDNPALCAAAADDRPVVPMYVYAPADEHPWEPGAASRWWLHHSLQALDKSLREQDSRLIIRRADDSKSAQAILAVLEKLIKETGATAVYWNRLYEPARIKHDASIEAALKANGIEVRSFNAALLREPDEIRNKQGNPFQVFTPFWKHYLTLNDPPHPRRTPTLKASKTWPRGETPDSLKLLPKIPWDREFYDEWTPGEAGAKSDCKPFCGRTWPITKPAAICPAKRRRRDCRRICTSARSARVKSGPQPNTRCPNMTRVRKWRPRSGIFCAKSLGANSPIICWFTIRTRPPNRCVKNSPRFPGAV
ncbi:MAG: deoxyribodipyrimidine photo-lyase [Pirellulales bacterium]